MESLLSPRPDPIDVPEILHHIFLHLDRPTLDICAKVSHFWRALALDVTAHSFILSKDILEYLTRRKEQEQGTNMGKSSEPQDRPIVSGGTTTATPTTLTNIPTDSKSQGALEFEGRCAGLRSLTIGDAWSGKTKYGEAFDASKVVQRESAVPASLTNLIRLDVRLVCAQQRYTWKDSLPNQVFRDILAQNPLIEELYFASGEHPGYDGLEALLFYPLQHLRCLNLQLTDHAYNFLEFWVMLVQRDKLQEQLRKTNPVVLASLRDPSPHTHEPRAAILKALPNWNLEELTIRNANPKETDIPFHGFLRYVLYDYSAPIYKLSLRSLTLEGFDMRQYEDGEPEENKSVLYHLLRTLPLLERLRISPDHTKVREPSPLPVREIVRANYLKLSCRGWLSPPFRLDEHLVRFCPHLRAIDLSHHRELDRHHWEDVLRFYAPQLESLVCWSVRCMSPNALRHLVPASPGVVLARGPQLSQNWIGLQELDISANQECDSVVRLFLKYVPTLRILRALGVPVDGAGLVGSDWACKDLEILAINIKVPTRLRAKILDPWSWSSWSREGWVRTPALTLKDTSNQNYHNFFTGDGEPILDVFAKLKTSNQPRLGLYEDAESEDEDAESEDEDAESEDEDAESEDEDAESEDEYDIAARLYEARKATAGYQERERKAQSILNSRRRTPADEVFLRWRSDQELQETDEDIAAIVRWKIRNKKVKAEKDRRNKEYNTQVQQQLCEQLGRLVKLRELTLEGCRYTGGEYKKRLLFDCLHLTLETGLDYLRPLQANLEKLVVYRLGERLSGGAEVEWIAKNWVHHTDPVWQQTFDTWDRQSYLEIPEEEDCNRALYPSSKFRQLIGVDTQKREGLDGASAAGNIAWLEYYCPELRVVKNGGKGSNCVVDSEDSESDLDSDDTDF